jgi:hypothetical protein
VGHFVKIRRVRVIGLNSAQGMGFHSRVVARLLFTFEGTKLARPNQPLLYFFQHDELAPGYGRTEENPFGQLPLGATAGGCDRLLLNSKRLEWFGE